MSSVVETAWKQREYDGRWERITKIKDYANAYSYKTDAGHTVQVVPDKWITIGVYDLIGDLE